MTIDQVKNLQPQLVFTHFIFMFVFYLPFIRRHRFEINSEKGERRLQLLINLPSDLLYIFQSKTIRITCLGFDNTIIFNTMIYVIIFFYNII